ncbi:MAG: hypothetical protein KA793_01615 [Bacteroidales bacterium]|nr:hypothetical protein [Bacteroidales bacterium]
MLWLSKPHDVIYHPEDDYNTARRNTCGGPFEKAKGSGVANPAPDHLKKCP